jgi:hypothetical protein
MNWKGIVLYGQVVKWGHDSVSVQGSVSPDEAKLSAILAAERMGWTNPRWWEFWRWDDTFFRPSELTRLKAPTANSETAVRS